ncbi:ATP-binding protein [Streptomyces sp. NPDC058045]|uniref:ATP-binding protein n=1 Tax=Streptomyces sp. NPDC058045 TaxID=3346311 RepID=UPI0036EAEE7C
MNPSPPLGTGALEAGGTGTATGAGPDVAGPRRYRFELAAHPGSAALARRTTRTRLSSWAVSGATCESAELVVSELVTNALVHTGSRSIVCELQDGDGRVRIAVRDEGRAHGDPRPCRADEEEEYGRGLLLVAAVCSAWGADDSGAGLLVWAELPYDGVPEPDCPAVPEQPCPPHAERIFPEPESGPGPAQGRESGPESEGSGPGTEAGWL